jgi:hypothetical protein
MALPKLEKLTDEEYKLLTPDRLALYNKDLPQQDYTNPYEHKDYPRMKYRLQKNADGSARLVSATVQDADEEKKLGTEWRRSPSDWKVVTAPAAPEFKVDEFSFDVPAEGKDAPAGA